jgi:hypothetical protein
LGKDKVSKLIFIDAFLPANGESVLSLAEMAGKANAMSNKPSQVPTLNESLVMSPDFKTSVINPANIASLFYHDCSPEDITFAKSHLGSQSMSCLNTPVAVTDGVYGAIPKYYILCSQAKDLDKTSISRNVRCEKVFTLESSHSPFFSMPEQLVHVIEQI